MFRCLVGWLSKRKDLRAFFPPLGELPLHSLASPVKLEILFNFSISILWGGGNGFRIMNKNFMEMKSDVAGDYGATIGGK